MGCICYENAANAAQGRKDKYVIQRDKNLEELEKCNTATTELGTAQSSVTSYSNTFRQLGAALEKVKVNGKAYDDGKCSEIAGNMDDILSTISDYLSTISTAITELEEENEELERKIADEDRIIANRWRDCGGHVQNTPYRVSQ